MIAPTPDFEWTEYFEAAENGKLHQLFEVAQPHLRPGLTALDLGCGVGLGTLHLCRQGLEVTAVDVHREALDRLAAKMAPDRTAHLVESDFRELDFHEGSFDIIVALNALYFLSPLELTRFWKKMTSWLKPGGIFLGNFMGPHDPWASRPDYNTQTEHTIKELFARFELLHHVDDEKDTVISTGKQRHVHVFHVMARLNKD